VRPYSIQAVRPDDFLVDQIVLDESLVVCRFSEQAANIGRTVEQQVRAFHQTGALQSFASAVAKAAGLKL
jgi:hypothetical protein